MTMIYPDDPFDLLPRIKFNESEDAGHEVAVSSKTGVTVFSECCADRMGRQTAEMLYAALRQYLHGDTLPLATIPADWTAVTDGEGEPWVRRKPGQPVWSTADDGPKMTLVEAEFLAEYGPVTKAVDPRA